MAFHDTKKNNGYHSLFSMFFSGHGVQTTRVHRQNLWIITWK